jgi:hypothetical protein
LNIDLQMPWLQVSAGEAVGAHSGEQNLVGKSIYLLVIRRAIASAWRGALRIDGAGDQKSGARGEDEGAQVVWERNNNGHFCAP